MNNRVYMLVCGTRVCAKCGRGFVADLLENLNQEVYPLLHLMLVAFWFTRALV